MTMQTGRVQRSNNLMTKDNQQEYKEEKRAMTCDNKKRKSYSPAKKSKTKRFVKVDEIPIYIK